MMAKIFLRNFIGKCRRSAFQRSPVGLPKWPFNDTGLPESPAEWNGYVRCQELAAGIPQNLADTVLDCSIYGGPVYRFSITGEVDVIKR